MNAFPGPHRHPILLGHRGSPKAARENTLESFRLAMSAGLDGVELDVQRSLDGVLVVHHDFHLPDGRLIAALQSAEIAAFELPGGARVPTLEATLAWAADADAYLNVEIKSRSLASDGREAETARLIGRFGLRNRVIVSSFNPASLARVRLADAALPCALLWDDSGEDGPDWLLRHGPTAWPLGVKAIHPHHRLVTPELMARARRYGWRVNVWTVNDLETAQRLVALGVDGLIGDYPQLLLEAAGRAGSPSSP